MGNTKRIPNKRQSKASSSKGTATRNAPYPLKTSSKNTKHAAKRDAWSKKIESAISEKNGRKKGQGVRGGAFNPDALMLSLPQVKSAHDEPESHPPKKQASVKSANQQAPKKPANPHKSRNRAKLLAEESRQFSQVLKHPAFKQDASQAIHQHIINKLKQEQSQ